MFPQYNRRNVAGEVAIWLLITVGALLIPTIVIAICCIRHHLVRRSPIKLIEKRAPHLKTMNIRARAALRTYNGPYVESGNDDRIASSQPVSNKNLINIKEHFHRSNGSSLPKGDDLRSIKDRQFIPRKQPLSSGDHFNTMVLTESPSSHRRPAVIPAPSSALSHLIQTAIIPAGSTIANTSANLLLTPTKQLKTNLAGYNSIV